MNCRVSSLQAVSQQQYLLHENDEQALASLKVPIPNSERDRIRVLREAHIFDTPSEESYDRHAAFASRIFQVRTLD